MCESNLAPYHFYTKEGQGKVKKSKFTGEEDSV